MARKQRGGARPAARPGPGRASVSGSGGAPRNGHHGLRPANLSPGGAPPSEEQEPEPDPTPSQLGDRYRIGRFLGEGGAARVSRATDLLLSREVAVKVLRQLPDPAAQRRAVRAAQAAARVNSRHLVTVLDVQGGRPAFLVLEVVEGRRLPDVIAEGVSEERARRLAEGILVGLMALHEAKLVHREVTADNVLVDESGDAVLTSAGLGQASDDPGLGPKPEDHEVRRPRPGPSPEQELGLAADARSDVYAAAMVIRRLLPSPAPPVELVLRTATAQDPEHRQQDASALFNELRQAFTTAPARADEAPVPAQEPVAPPAPRERSFGRSIAAVAVLALLVGFFLLRDRPEPTTQTDAPVQAFPVPSGPEAAQSAAPAPAPAPATPTAPLSQLIAEAERDPAALGPGGRALLDGLRVLDGLRGAERGAEVANQYGATMVGAARGSIDSAFADRVAATLRPELDAAGLFACVAQRPLAAGEDGGVLVGALRGFIAMPQNDVRTARGEELGIFVAELAQRDTLSASIASSAIAILNDTAPGPSRIAEGGLVIPADESFTDTGLDVPAGSIVVLTATGEVTIGRIGTGPEGIADRPDLGTGSVVPDANHGALVARIGRNGTPFVVGADAVFPVADRGRLYLGVNDDDTGGNRGGFEVQLRYRGP